MATFLQKLGSILQDPPPDFVFELTENGIAFARPAAGVPPSFSPLEPGILSVSPLSDNVLRADALADRIRAISGGGSGRKRGSAVVILPDFSSRLAVLAFDQFPSHAEEQLSLVRFRMKKTVPFDVESAVISYHVQQSGKGRTDVIVAVATLEIIARYEAAFRAAGLHPGCVAPAATTVVELIPSTGITVCARLAGQFLSVLVTNGPSLRLVRTVELTDGSPDDILAVLFPTLAYVEDELGAVATRLNLCGFDEAGRVPEWISELQIPVEPMKSRFGTPNGHNAGLLGYLESMTRGVKAA